jgi:hypothetical protein
MRQGGFFMIMKKGNDHAAITFIGFPLSECCIRFFDGNSLLHGLQIGIGVDQGWQQHPAALHRERA